MTSDRRTWTPELAAGLAGASLPGASLARYYLKDLPALRSRIGGIPIMTLSELKRRARLGDVGFEGAVRSTLNMGPVGVAAAGSQGTPLYHTFVVGPGKKTIHGGFHHLAGEQAVSDVLGRWLWPAYDVAADVAGGTFSPSKLYATFRRERAEADKNFARQLRAAARAARNDAQWRSTLKSIPGFMSRYKGMDSAVALYRPQLDKMPPRDVIRLLRRMGPLPYSETKATLGGLLNILLPLRNIRRPAGACEIGGSAMCGDLSASLLKQLGVSSRPGQWAMPGDIMMEPGLKPVGLAMTPEALKSVEGGRAGIRKILQDAIRTSSRLRTAGGVAGMLGLGGLAAGAVGLRRLSEPEENKGYFEGIRDRLKKMME